MRLHEHFDVDPLAASTESNSLYRSHIAVISSPRKRDVTIGRQHVVGGVEMPPPEFGNEGCYPGMGSLRALGTGPAADCAV